MGLSADMVGLTFRSTGGTFTGLFKGRHVYRNACVALVISRNDNIVGGPVKRIIIPKYIYLWLPSLTSRVVAWPLGSPP